MAAFARFSDIIYGLKVFSGYQEKTPGVNL